ncbi:AfsA-related hotdog domain-containing protein [Streptomyces flavofungini]|uniref:AfsA-related hotdog domain-containing protein n=1 Tax=Streptomyces flavofungini TaxID=68200 RepID=UPI0034DF5CCF
MTTASAHPAADQLRFERTVPRSIAHRRQIGEVFVADSVQSSDDDFHLSFQIPRAHSLWSDRHPSHHDPFASAEAARQAIFVLLHRHVGVPVGLPFSLQRIELRVEDPQAYADDGRSALQGRLHYRIAERRHKGSDVMGMGLEGVMEVAGRGAMTLSARLAFMSQDDYDLFRAFRRSGKPLVAPELTPVRRLAPARVGREIARNVVIGTADQEPGSPEDGVYRCLLAADPGHPAFFDHEYDHVPGPLMVEGLRQAALVAAHRGGAVPDAHALTVGCEASFLDFAEFDADLVHEARVGTPASDGRVPVAVGLRQSGRTVVEGRVTLLPRPTAPRTTRRHGG